ncbi:hypothetical protein SDC9_205823 [bioreactor metagenome]|uniref:Uncharacterized protein n=1 Tax=bioreactor metagenome TaxID=1076179 RepID=A0A645J4R1_9ZZZZ
MVAQLGSAGQRRDVIAQHLGGRRYGGLNLGLRRSTSGQVTHRQQLGDEGVGALVSEAVIDLRLKTADLVNLVVGLADGAFDAFLILRLILAWNLIDDGDHLVADCTPVLLVGLCGRTEHRADDAQAEHHQQHPDPRRRQPRRNH